MSGRELTPRRELGQLVVAAADYARASRAESTRRAYAGDWKDFTAWCETRRACSLPAEASVVAIYLTDLAQGGLQVSTMARRLAAIRAAHKAAGHAEPRSPGLDEVWSGIRRSHGRPPRKKRALGVKALQKVVKAMPGGLKGLRDTAIILVGFGMAARRSEIAALDLAGPGAGPVRARFVDGGLEIAIDKSKGDQAGKGAVLGIAYGKRICAVLALRAWLSAAQITEGAVFRQMHRSGRVLEARMSGAAIAAVIKEAAARVGLDPDDIGGHSVRSGFITDAMAAGARPEKVMAQSRHARFDTMRGYIQDADRFKDNPSGKLM